MPKVIYTPSKGLYQTSGSGIEISDVSILPTSTSLAPGGPVYVLTLTVPESPAPDDDYINNTITIARADGTEDSLVILNGSGDIDSSLWGSTADAANGIGRAIAGLGTSANTEFAYSISTVSADDDTITIYSLKAGESGADIAVAGGTNIAASTTTQGVSGEISGRNNVAIDVVASSDVANLLGSGGSGLGALASGLTGITLANGTSVGQKIYVMNNSTYRAVWVTGTYFDCTNNDPDTILKLEATEIQQLIWNGSAWAEGPLVSGSPAFA